MQSLDETARFQLAAKPERNIGAAAAAPYSCPVQGTQYNTATCNSNSIVYSDQKGLKSETAIIG